MNHDRLSDLRRQDLIIGLLSAILRNQFTGTVPDKFERDAHLKLIAEAEAEHNRLRTEICVRSQIPPPNSGTY